MISFINKFKIPTLLGLGIIFSGITAGVFLVLKEQIFISNASPNLIPQNIILSNISDDSLVISWQTSQLTTSFLTFGQANPDQQTVLDDRDSSFPNSHLTHYVTIKNLLPKTSYQYKIFSGKYPSEVFKFTTASPITNQAEFTPVIGSVLDKNRPLSDGVVYLSIADATIQSAQVKNSGNFLLSLSQVRKNDLSNAYQLTKDTTVKLTVISDKGQASSLFKLKDATKPLPPLKLGQNVDLSDIQIPQSQPASPSASELNRFDLNSDGKINATDYAIILQNFGKNPKNKKADLNNDGIVDQKDLDLMAQKLKDLGSQ